MHSPLLNFKHNEKKKRKSNVHFVNKVHFKYIIVQYNSQIITSYSLT